MNELGRWTLVIAMMLGAAGCGAAAGGGGAPDASAAMPDASAPRSDASTAPTVSAQCGAACARIAQCSAMEGSPIEEPSCRASCAASNPSAACFGCFSGPCATSCGEACAMCFFSNCASLAVPGTTPPDPMPAPDASTAPPDASEPAPDATPPEPMCGTGTLHADIGRECQGDFQCGTRVCNTNTRNALNSYCTQACSSIADCPCAGGTWACQLIPGRSAVQRYCVDTRL